MDDSEIKAIALANGFKLTDQGMGGIDLDENVYAFARALLAEGPDAKDAARYRWLRNDAIGFDQIGSTSPYAVTGQSMEPLEGEQLDTAIDAEV